MRLPVDHRPPRAENQGSEANLSHSHHEPVADGVLGHRPGLDEVKEIVRTARLGTGPGQPVAAERLPSYLGAGDSAVDIQVSDRASRPQVADRAGISRDR